LEKQIWKSKNHYFRLFEKHSNELDIVHEIIECFIGNYNIANKINVVGQGI
jgi:hypothetical protein